MAVSWPRWRQRGESTSRRSLARCDAGLLLGIIVIFTILALDCTEFGCGPPPPFAELWILPPVHRISVRYPPKNDRGDLITGPHSARIMKRKLGALEKVEADLPNLQNKIRRDPPSYKDDFANQFQQYHSFLALFLQAPTSSDAQGLVSLRDLIDFIAHVADCYPQICADFPSDLIHLLNKHHAELDPELREKIVGSLVLLRRKDIIDSTRSVQHSFC